MERAAGAPTFAGGAFDFISVCPPYLLVSYPQLFQLLEVRTFAYVPGSFHRSVTFLRWRVRRSCPVYLLLSKTLIPGVPSCLSR